MLTLVYIKSATNNISQWYVISNKILCFSGYVMNLYILKNAVITIAVHSFSSAHNTCGA